MHREYTSLGLMSGTSGDGVDASIIISNGIDKFELVKDKYYEYDPKIYRDFHSLKEKIIKADDLFKHSKDVSNLENKITLFHAKIIKDLDLINDDLIIGFHGQTIFHNPKEKISKQIGNANLLNQLTKKKIVFNFRKNDILNGGEGAPLTPLFHQLITTQKKIRLPVCILNIGGISNISIIEEPMGSVKFNSKDIGPGNCLIDAWIRKNSDKKFDTNGLLASNGSINEIILEQAQELYTNRLNKDKISFDTNDFDISFSRGLSLQDGAATLTEFTARIIGESLSLSLNNKELIIRDIIICGGGRKNKILLASIKKYLPANTNIKMLDDYGIDGDFVESQAFAFLAIRTYKNLPISFPSTTNCKSPTVGGEILEN